MKKVKNKNSLHPTNQMKNLVSAGDPATIRKYFEKIIELRDSGKAFPVSLEDVWPLAYQRKDAALDELKSSFIEGVDYNLLQKGKVLKINELKNGIRIDVELSVGCLEFFIARKVRAIFELYRSVFHKVTEPTVNPFNQIEKHGKRPIQIGNSKDVNCYNFTHGGIEETIEYNRRNCLIHTGYTPSEVKEYAKKVGLPSKQRTSAKEIFRHKRPEVAASMSMTDEFCKTGKMDVEEAAEFCKNTALPLFAKMREHGLLVS